MKKEMQDLLQTMYAERDLILKQQEALDKQVRSMAQTRQGIAQECVNNLLPDLSSETIKNLRRKVPAFSIPMKLGLIGKFVNLFGGHATGELNSSVSLDSLRIHLGAFLDNPVQKKPKEWSEIDIIDGAIYMMQKKPIKKCAEDLDDLSQRIRAIERLAAMDEKMWNPEIRNKIEEAVRSEAKHFLANFGRTQSSRRKKIITPVSYPTREQISSDIGPSLLELWLWNQLLTPHSDVVQEIQQFEPGGGTFGGAGASGDFMDKEEASRVVEASDPPQSEAESETDYDSETDNESNNDDHDSTE
jgi:hypothetical protein